MESVFSSPDRQGHLDEASAGLSSNAPMTPRRRARTKEISAGRPSTSSLVIPDRSHQATLASSDSVNISPIATNSRASRQDISNPAVGTTSHENKRSHHRRRSSAGLNSSSIEEHSLKRSESTSSKSGSRGHSSRKSWVPNSPSSAWLARKMERGNEAKVASMSPPPGPSSAGRARSNSAISSSASAKTRTEALNVNPNVNEIGTDMEGRNQFGRRSNHTTPSKRSEPSTSSTDPFSARLQHARAAVSAATAAQKDKRNIFRKREDSVESSHSGRGSGRRGNARSFYRSGKDKSEEGLNVSSETLASNGTSGTTRRSESTLNKSRSISRWKRRSLRADSISQEGQRSPSSASPNGSQAAAEEWDNDFIHRGDGLNSSTPRQNRSETVNSLGAIAREEGLPRRFGGWISNILNSSINGEGNSQLSSSQSSNTVRRKASTISLSLKGSSQGTASPLLAPIDTVVPTNVDGHSSHSPAPKSRNAGLLSTLTNSNRGGRAESPSSISSNSTGARTGLDRALRYFLDHGEGDNTEEGKWLLGVWHGPETSQDDERDVFPHTTVNDATSKTRDSRSSTLDGDTSSQSRRGSDLDFDDNSVGSRRTRETSPSVASASTREESSHGHKDNKRDDELSTKNTDNLQTPQGTTKRNLSQASTTESKSYTASFQADFSSRIWCTYRSHFVPITRDGTISRQAEMAAAEAAIAISNTAQSILRAGLNTVRKTGDITPTDSSSLRGMTPFTSQEDPDISQLSSDTAHADQTNTSTLTATSNTTLGGILNVAAPANLILNNTLGERMGLPSLWNRATAAAQAYGLTGRAGLTTDAGWGCMLRTGQSVLANALLNVHLGREWRRGEEESLEEEVRQERYAKYVQLLSWFMDEPSLACPFGVHRMAREGKRLGKEVGEWFGPSTAGGAIKKLVDEYPAAGIGASLGSDGVVYLDQIRAQSRIHTSNDTEEWNRPVLILIGIRLGLEGVHAMYHDSIKAIFTFPQSVGIAGGRPSSSYYFVGYQGNGLFYLDPHHVRASIPLRHPPPEKVNDSQWWSQAYSEAELSTFHTDRPRRMPMKTLDPSMLLGFLIKDEESMNDFVNRVKALPRPIFSVLESMPRWMMEEEEGGMHDDERALESFSEDSQEEEERSVMTEEAGDDTSRKMDQNANERKSKSKEKRPNLSIMSHDTMTPRSESTFEMIDRAQGISINDRDTENGSFTDIGITSTSDQQGHLAKALSTFTLSTSPGTHHNHTTDKDESFSWEEVKK